MIGRQDRWQEELFVVGPLRDLIPDDHILKRVNPVLDLNWLRAEVAPLYVEDRGRCSIDPETVVRLMLAGFLLGIVHDRELMRDAHVNVAIRWFAGYRLQDALPHHSSFTKIRQRWGEERFAAIFHKTVSQCVKAGLVKGDIVHIDATLVRADVSWESLVERHLEELKIANADAPLDEDDDEGQPRKPAQSESRSRTGKPKKISATDPDATMATSSKHSRMEPTYKQHTAVDDHAGVIVDVHVTTGETSEGHELPAQLERVERNTGRMVQTVTNDSAYAHPANLAMLEERGTRGIIPPQKQGANSKVIPACRFKYDARNKIVRCPARKILTRSTRPDDRSWVYRARSADCRRCALRSGCISSSAKVRVIRIGDHHESLLRARRRHARWGDDERALYRRHRWRAEGAHAEAKTRHGLRRAVRRRLWNVKIQAYLTAAAMNLKRLAALLRAFRARWIPRMRADVWLRSATVIH